MPIISSIGAFNVYPNQTGDIINIKLTSEESGNYILSLYDIAGREQLKRAISMVSFSESKMDISSLPSGCYVLKIMGEKSTYTTKVNKN